LTSRRNEIRVGLAVIISLITLVGGIMWGKGYRLKTSRYPFEVIFTNVGGLESGANVLANGVIKGRVTSIILQGGKVLVKGTIDKNVMIFSDYRITIESPTVMAGKALSVLPGQTLPLADLAHPLSGESPMGMSEAVAMFQDISSDLRRALKDLDTLLVSVNHVAADTVNQRHVTEMITNASSAAKTTSEWLAENRAQLTATLDELTATLVATKTFMQNTDSRLGGTMTGVDSAMAQITGLTASLKETVDRINRSEGTVGKIISSDELYIRLNQTLAQVDSLARSIRTQGMKQRIVLF
jgi:phospholipid/cholesterol/gamma-HCH transport system substrate-binding protein